MSIRLPLPAMVSILHRASGFLLFLALPLLLLAFQNSLQSPQGYEQVLRELQGPLAKVLRLGLICAFTHHFLAGMRHLAMDMHWGSELAQARLTGKLVLAIDATMVVWSACWLW
jgi:succinate dehydrogenase / fumarate reductase cytochrome b subunit